jgi:hypothetical protein
MQDFLYRDLEVDDIVAFEGPNGGGMTVGKVVGFTPKQIRITPLSKNYSWSSNGKITRYPTQCIKVPEDEITMYLIRQKPEHAAK